jgi:hypothetical protein
VNEADPKKGEAERPEGFGLGFLTLPSTKWHAPHASRGQPTAMLSRAKA